MALVAVPALHLQIANLDENAGNVQPMLRGKGLDGGDVFVYAETNRISPDKMEITGIAPGNYKVSLQTFGRRVEDPKVFANKR